MKEFTTAVEDVLSEDAGEKPEERFIPFSLDGRELHAYQPTDGQLAFMLAALGRGQSNEGRFAAIINIMLACLRDEDRDYLEGRLLSRDKSERLEIRQVEEIFGYLTEEWFREDVPSSGTSV